MAGFTLTNWAKADLKEIGRYTQERWGREQRNTYLTRLDACFRQLAANPLTGKECDDIPEGSAKSRWAAIWFSTAARVTTLPRLSVCCMAAWMLRRSFPNRLPHHKRIPLLKNKSVPFLPSPFYPFYPKPLSAESFASLETFSLVPMAWKFRRVPFAMGFRRSCSWASPNASACTMIRCFASTVATRRSPGSRRARASYRPIRCP